MNLLLDTHVLLWWLDDNPALGPPAREAIADPGYLVFVSAVSIWEIVIKKSIGKLHVPDEFPQVLGEQPFHRLDGCVHTVADQDQESGFLDLHRASRLYTLPHATLHHPLLVVASAAPS